MIRAVLFPFLLAIAGLDALPDALPDATAESAEVRSNQVLTRLTKTLEVVKVPGRWETYCRNCPPRWVPPVMEKIEVKPDMAKVDEAALVKYHWRLGPGSCGMIGCLVHPGTRELVDERGNPAPPGAKATEQEESERSAACERQGWYPAKRLKALFGR